MMALMNTSQSDSKGASETTDERCADSPLVCALCGTPNDADAVFCKNCGARQVLQIGDIEFTRHGVVVTRDGQIVTSVPRSEISSIEIESGASATRPVKTIFWGVGAFIAGLRIISTATSSIVFFGVLLILFAVLMIGSTAYSRTIVRIWGGGTMKVIRVGRALAPTRVAEIQQELRDQLGYPVN
jgi:hypothetical protein